MGSRAKAVEIKPHKILELVVGIEKQGVVREMIFHCHEYKIIDFSLTLYWKEGFDRTMIGHFPKISYVYDAKYLKSSELRETEPYLCSRVG